VNIGDREIAYDYLILATGSRHSYFGHDEWEKLAPGLKSLEDAIEIRRRPAARIRVREKIADESAKKAAMTFVVIGAVRQEWKWAGAIAEIARYTLDKDFKHIDPSSARVVLVEGDKRVLSSFPEDLSVKAMEQLKELGIEVHTGIHAKDLTEEGLKVGDEFIRCRLKVWAAGKHGTFVGKTTGAPVDRVGRVIVNDDLTIPGHPKCRVIGDLANFSHRDGKPLPGVSPVAMQQGRHAAAKHPRDEWTSGSRSAFVTGQGQHGHDRPHRAVADLHLVTSAGCPPGWRGFSFTSFSWSASATASRS